MQIKKKNTCCSIQPGPKHFADGVNFSVRGEQAVYLVWQLRLRGSDGSKAHLLIMDIRPRNWRSELMSPTRGSWPRYFPTLYTEAESPDVFIKRDSLNASHTLRNRSHHWCIIDIAPFYLPSCVSFPWKLRSYIHDGMKISN